MASLYIHVPFCKTRCAYCDFYSQTHLIYINVYTKAIICELELRNGYLEGEAIETIYWGGGTPSLLQPDNFELIFSAIHRFYDTSSCSEITLEANPDDITESYLTALRRLPFNRISLGVQSFNDNDLRLLNRRHTAQQACDAVSLCQKAGYSNLSIDLIYGLPGQTPEMWKENVDKALRLNIPHLSAYHLSYEEGTVMYRQLNEKMIEPVSEETSVILFNLLIDKLEAAGYLHYEISNFCKPGYFSRHNTAYWTDRNYLGIGPAAHSYNHHSRQWNIDSLTDYIEGIMKEVQGSRFKVQSSKFKVQSARFKVQSARFKVQSARCKVQSARCKVQSARCKVQGAKFHVPCFKSQQPETRNVVSYSGNQKHFFVQSPPLQGAGGCRGFFEKEIIDTKTRYNDYIMTRLRTMWGIPKPSFLERFGRQQMDYLLQQAKPYLQNGMIEQNEEMLRITRKGLFVADGIIRNLMK